MALHRGIQSAIFYYLSCAPCTEARDRKRRKREAERDQNERAALEAEMPHIYRHPLASSTNPNWQAEIEEGPFLVRRGGKKKGGINGGINGGDSKGKVSGVPSSLDLSSREGATSRDGRVDSRWQFQQFQREDEPGGSEIDLARFASSSTLDGSAGSGRSGVTRPAKAKMKVGMEARNPEVSERHPAIARKIASREEAQWLMAPPPTADFMSGKERGTRSRSDSGGSSRLSARSGVPLSREVSRRIIEQKMRNGEVLTTPPLSREGTTQSSNDSSTLKVTTEEKDFAFPDSPVKKTRTRAMSAGYVDSSENSVDTSQTTIRTPELAPQQLRARRVASRPQLSTITSDSIFAAEEHEVYAPAQMPLQKAILDSGANSMSGRDRISRRSPIVPDADESFEVLQRFASESAEFELSQWVHEHTKREVTQRHRWSMEI